MIWLDWLNLLKWNEKLYIMEIEGETVDGIDYIWMVDYNC